MKLSMNSGSKNMSLKIISKLQQGKPEKNNEVNSNAVWRNPSRCGLTAYGIYYPIWRNLV
jgi:hypothetical protein